jgi:anti-sigma factor RsiW
VTDEPGHLACTSVVELATDYLEGALPGPESRRLEQHLDTCPGCTEYVEQLRTIAGSLRGLSAESLPAGMRDDLITRFRHR